MHQNHLGGLLEQTSRSYPGISGKVALGKGLWPRVSNKFLGGADVAGLMTTVREPLN